MSKVFNQNDVFVVINEFQDVLFLDRIANYYILTKWLNYRRFCFNDCVILLNYLIVLHDAAFIILTY